jgi:hypothetical protein
MVKTLLHDGGVFSVVAVGEEFMSARLVIFPWLNAILQI